MMPPNENNHLQQINFLSIDFKKYSKPIILVNYGIGDGIGDLVHGMEISKHLKEKYGAKYHIVILISCDLKYAKPIQLKKMQSLQLDVNNNPNSIYGDGIYHIKSMRDELIPTATINISKSVDEHRKQAMEYQAKIKEYNGKFIDFLKENNIVLFMQISCIPTCLRSDLAQSRHYLNIPKLDFILNVSEYGMVYDIYNQLNMGFSDSNSGIRIYPPLVVEDFQRKLQTEQEDFYSKLVNLDDQHTSLNQYFKVKRLLPADLRDEESILQFIQLNLNILKDKCDFYLPKDMIEKCQRKIQEICEAHGKKCEFVNPDTDVCDAKLNDNSTIRFFSGFDLSDDLYKGLYLCHSTIEKQISLNPEIKLAGVYGDDGVSLAISGDLLPFFGNIVEQQMINLRKLKNFCQKQGFTKLYEFYDLNYKLLNTTDKVKQFEELELFITKNLEKIQAEFPSFIKTIKEQKDFFKQLDAYLEKKQLLLQLVHNEIKPHLT